MKAQWTIALVWVATFVGVPSAFSQSGLRPDSSDSSAQVTQQEELARDNARKHEIVATILSQRERASDRTFSPGLRSALAGKLLSVPTASLEAFSAAGSLGEVDTLVHDTVGPRVLGDASADLVFTPVTPCRIVNTVATGTPLAANTSRAFYVNGNAADVFEAQGGKAGGCGIPDTATAVEMNFVAVGPVAGGDLRAFPWNATPVVPLASVINYANVAGLNVANGLAQPVCNASTTICTFDLIVRADVAQSHLIIDVVGYYNKVNKAQIRTFAVSSRVSSAYATIPPGCTNVGGLSVTVNAPVAGTVFVDAGIVYLFNHTVATADHVNTTVGTSATQCLSTYGDVSVNYLPAQAPSGDSWSFNTFARRTETVAAGSTTTFFVNSLQQSGAGNDEWAHGSIKAIFVPN